MTENLPNESPGGSTRGGGLVWTKIPHGYPRRSKWTEKFCEDKVLHSTEIFVYTRMDLGRSKISKYLFISLLCI